VAAADARSPTAAASLHAAPHHAKLQGVVTAGMTSPEGRSSWAANGLLVLSSILLSVVGTELVVREINGQPLFAFHLPEAIDTGSTNPQHIDAIPRAPGVDRAWILTNPPPLPNRRPTPEGWQRAYETLRARVGDNALFQPSDIFKVWNSAFARDPCKHEFFRMAPAGPLYLYDPPDGNPSPPFRFYPDVTLPDQLVTNQIGWRGPPIEVPRRPRTVRIVFAGSSTVAEGHPLPYSYPELIGHWLTLWAQSRKLDVRFEVLNSARESNNSTDIANVVRTEVLPLHPDLVVYHEGGNQFRPQALVDKVPEGTAAPRPNTGANVAPGWLRSASRYSALLGRVQTAIGFAASDLDGREWPKPDYKLVWPPGLDEQDPDLGYPNLPISLNQIQRDLDRIRSDLGTIGSEFALSSFAWMVKDGLVLDPISHGYMLNQLNTWWFPLRYGDIERLVNFQNRFFAKYARVTGIPFIDVAGQLPLDPAIFLDAVHTSSGGSRLRGWITFNQLIPLIDKHLADKSWPRAMPGPEPALPTFTPRHITLDCKPA
jgi:hypothetical protein